MPHGLPLGHDFRRTPLTRVYGLQLYKLTQDLQCASRSSCPDPSHLHTFTDPYQARFGKTVH
jgi:hypothetical protein